MAVNLDSYKAFLGDDAETQDARIRKNAERAKNFLAITDGTGRGLAEGTKFRWPSQEVINAGVAYNFDTFNGNDYAQVLVESLEDRVIGVTSSKLSAHLTEVKKDGKPTGKIVQPEGWLAEAWRGDGGRKKLTDRIQAVRDAIDKNGKIAYFQIENVRDVRVPLFRSDANDPNHKEPYSVVQVMDFVAYDSKDKRIEWK